MKKKLTCLLAALLMLAVLGCKKSSETTAEATPGPSSTPETAIVVVEQMPVHSDSWEDILNEEVPPPEEMESAISQTTGYEIDALQVYRPVFVCFNNAQDALPLSGIAEADIVYEAPAMNNGGGTRLMALFSDSYPAAVGPLGMMYSDFAAIQKEWGGMTVYEGYPSEEGYPELNEADFAMRTTNEGEAKEFFFTLENAEGVFIDLETMLPKLFKAGIVAPSLRFLLAEGYVYEGASAAERVQLSFGGGKDERVEYWYDAEAGNYQRYQAAKDGSLIAAEAVSWNKETEAAENVPICIQSLIVQYADAFEGGLSAVGSGKCDFFTAGLKLTGTWERESPDTATQYYLDDGSVVTLTTGHTWIALHPADTPAKVV